MKNYSRDHNVVMLPCIANSVFKKLIVITAYSVEL